ncbi:MAG TPA: ABC transporter ATP-binding protein [Longimicrobiales bacterium]|nr:ABC transporter ATP-binding protein [Longimicrobiales bacterium]
MIATEKLTRRYEDKIALSQLDMRVEPGEILGFLGPNGAGKSTTVKILTGMIRPTSGRAFVAGYDVAEQPLEVKKRIGYVPETGALYESLSPLEYLEMVACLHHLDPAAIQARSHEFLELFGLQDVKTQQMSEFSKGMKQKVVLSAALIHRPEVIFFDEPLNGLDAGAATIVKELVRKLAEQGKTVLFCSHILEVVERMCTRIVVIDHGKQIASGTAEEIARQTGTTTLEAAFNELTGVRNVGQLTTDFLAALDRA